MALPDYSFIEGFDKYGNDVMDLTSANVYAALTTGEWSGGVQPGNVNIVASLSGPGYALQYGDGAGGNFTLFKTLSNNYARIIGGCTLKNPSMTASSSQKTGFIFTDGTTAQVSISFSATGKLEVWRGSTNTGTLLATGTSVITSSQVNCVEWDITFHGTAGIVKVWLNGVAEPNLSLTGQNTAPTGNAYMNRLTLQTGNATSTIFDHYYAWLYTASGGTETPALTNPVVETHFSTADVQKQWTTGIGILGNKVMGTMSANNAPGANQLVLIRVSAQVAATLNSIGITPAATSAAAKFKGVIYSDSAGSPNTLLSSGTEVVGTTSGTQMTLPLVTPQTLVAGTYYWIGYITDTSVAIYRYDSTAVGQRAANTYASGAPGTAPTMTTGLSTWMIWGNTTGMTVNWSQENDGLYASDATYNYSATVGQEDLYSFDNLSSVPANIYTVAVKALVQRVGSGVRTIDLHTKSGATDSSGSLAAQSVPASLTMYGSYYNVDPNTSAAWTYAGLNGASHGVKINS